MLRLQTKNIATEVREAAVGEEEAVAEEVHPPHPHPPRAGASGSRPSPEDIHTTSGSQFTTSAMISTKCLCTTNARTGKQKTVVEGRRSRRAARRWHQLASKPATVGHCPAPSGVGLIYAKDTHCDDTYTEGNMCEDTDTNGNLCKDIECEIR